MGRCRNDVATASLAYFVQRDSYGDCANLREAGFWLGVSCLFARTSPFGHLTDQSRDMGALAAIRGMPRSKQSSGGGQTRRPYRLAPWFYRYRHGRSVGAGDVGVPRCARWAPGEPSGESLDLGVAALPETGCHDPQPLPGRRHLAAPNAHLSTTSTANSACLRLSPRGSAWCTVYFAVRTCCAY